MGQKVNPHLIRLQTVHTWSSRWFSDKNYKETVLEDYALRKGMNVAEVERWLAPNLGYDAD